MSYPIAKLRGRYQIMAAFEVFNAVVLMPLLPVLFGWPLTLPNVVGLVSVALLLLVGAAYWFVKVRQLDRRTPLPEGLGAFSVVRIAGWVLVGASLAVVVVVRDDRVIGWLPGLGLALFAMLEQVNYFHVQLSHDNKHDLERLLRSGLRPSKLARDLAARRSGTTPVGLRFPAPRP